MYIASHVVVVPAYERVQRDVHHAVHGEWCAVSPASGERSTFARDRRPPLPWRESRRWMV